MMAQQQANQPGADQALVWSPDAADGDTRVACLRA